MADFFKSNDFNYDNSIQGSKNPYAEGIEEYRQKKQERFETRQRFGAELTDEQFAQVKDFIAASDNPEETEYKIKCALQFSNNAKIPFTEAFANVDNYIHELWDDKQTTSYRSALTAITDSFVMGANNVKIGNLGNKIAEAEKKGDKEGSAVYLQEYEALMKDNELRYDSAPRKWVTNVIKAGVQSAPYTGAVAGAAMLGSFVPGGQVAAGFTGGLYLMRGQAYLDMRAKGIDPDVAYKVSIVSAVPQAAIETALGEVAAWAGAGAKLAGGKILEKTGLKTVSDTVSTKIAENLARKYSLGAGAKLATKLATEYLGNLAEEGTEEFAQELIGESVENIAIAIQNNRNAQTRTNLLDQAGDQISDELRRELEEELLEQYPDIDGNSLAEILKNSTESFKGGVMGALALGIVPSTVNTAVTARDYQGVKTIAEHIPSKETFKKFCNENESAKKVFEQFEEGKERNDAISQVWENSQNTRDKHDAEIIANTKETTAFNENMEEAPAENEDGESAIIPAARDEKGRLYTEDTLNEKADGEPQTGTFTIGNPEASDKNLYGFINYTVDEANNTLTINDFKMTAYRRGLTQEAFDEFAQEHAGTNIEWNPTTKAGKELKALLINNNASGRNNGLNYYTQENLIEAETRRSLSKQLIKYMPNLNADERAAAVALLESGARRMGKSLSTYISETFNGEIFGELKSLENQITPIQRQSMKGASNFRQYGNQVKAVIYASEHADFSTFAHEVAHIWQAQLTGDLLAQAEKAFNVKDGDWQNSMFTFADGHQESSAEAFARGFEDYLRTGKAPNAQAKTLFQKFAEFLQDVYRHLKNFITMSPEIESVYNQLMDADDSVLALAQKAVEQGDKEYIAEYHAQQKAKQELDKQQKEAEEKAKQDQKDEESEITLSDEKIAEPDLSITEEETEQKTQEEATKETTDKPYENEEDLNKNLEELTSFFDEMATDTEAQAVEQYQDIATQALCEMTLTPLEAEQAVKTVTNKEETFQKKTETAAKAASKTYDDEILIFQLAGLEGVRNIVSTEERARRTENYYRALEMSERTNTGYDAETLARKIKQMTGWEKNASGKWVYETDDSVGFINPSVAKIINDKRAGALSDKKIKPIPLSMLYKNDELYEMYPIAKDFIVQFYTENNAVNAAITSNGIIVNTVGLSDPDTLKRRLVHEIQHIIQAVENYAEGNTDVSSAGIHGKSFAELYESLREVQTTKGVMYDASNLDLNMSNYMNNAAEIDARNVARRALMSEKERRATLLGDTADVSTPILFQLIGEQGAANLDKAEEATTRMDNLSIAKDMETAGKDAKTIRLATGWEKAKDGLWRYEIADDYHLKNIKATNAKLEKYEKELKEAKKEYDYLTGLTEEEKQKKRRMIADMVKHNALEEGTTLETMIEEAEQKVNMAEMLLEYDTLLDVEKALKRLIERGVNPKDFWDDMGESFYLSNLIDNDELFKAYPQLEKVTIDFARYDVDRHQGSYDANENSIRIFPAGMRSYGQFISTLAHEVQHAIQRIEGFAVGGSAAQFKEMEAPSKLQEKIMLLDDIPMNELMNYKQHDEFKFLKENLPEVLEDNIDGLGTLEQIMDRWIEDVKNGIHTIQNVYDEIQNARKAYNKYNRLNEFANEKSAFEKYESLAGEVEARNVQSRIHMTPEERLNTLLTETADVAPEDQIVLFDGATSESQKQVQLNAEKEVTRILDTKEHSKESINYKTEHYDNKKDEYEEREFTTSNGEKITVEAPKARDPEQKEIDEVAFLKKLNIPCIFLEEPGKEEGGYPDLLVFGNTLAELKEVTGNKKSALNRIKEAINKRAVEVPLIFFLTNKDITTDEIIDNLNTYPEDLKRDVKNILLIRDYKTIDILEKNYPGATYVATQVDLNVNDFSNSVNNIQFQKVYHGSGASFDRFNIFNDDEARIVDHLQFQTHTELLKDAANFDNWQEFMEYYEREGGKPEVNLVPPESDEAWYKATWELAKGITHQESEDLTKEEQLTERSQDAMFMVHMEQPGVLENFLQEVNYINTLDFDTMGAAMDEEEQQERNRQAQLKDYIAHKLRHGSWISNATRVAQGKELTPSTRKRLLNLISLAAREYRDVYTHITGDNTYAVPESQSYFETNIAKNAKKLNKLLTPEEALAMSPEQLRALADSLSDEASNKEIAYRIKKGNLKMDDELKNYIVRLDRRLKDAEKKYEELKAETQEDYNRINDYAQRELLRTYEELLQARAKLNNKKNALDKKISAGLKITDKYQRDVYKAQATYDDIFKTWNNLTRVNRISAEVQEAMKRKEMYIAAVEEQAKLKNDKAILTQISDMRRKLVKNAMRRVPLDRVEYNHAKQIIAIQRIFYPNLKYGIESWIGETPVYLKGLVSEYLTNAEIKADIDKMLERKRLRATNRQRPRIERLQTLLRELKTSDDVNQWDEKEKQSLIRYFPKNEWIKELNLEKLEEERIDSMQLDIEEEGDIITKTVTDEKGKTNVLVRHKTKFSDEIGQMVKESLGAELYNQLVNKSFEDWTTSEMERFTKRINEIYTEGRDELEAKRQAQKDEANAIRERIREAVRNTGIEFNDTDTPEEHDAKLAKLDRVLGNDSTVKGSFASKKEKAQGKIGRFLHGYNDANVRRFARIIDGYDEGVNTQELFFKENECYVNKMEMLRKRNAKIDAVLKENDIDLKELYQTINVEGNSYSVDDLLYILAADQDYELIETKNGDLINDDYAPTARNAVMFGNLGSSNDLLEEKERYKQQDEETKERFANNDFTEEEKKTMEEGFSVTSTPGTQSYIAKCHIKYENVLNAAKEFIANNPKFERLLEAIDGDYTEQFERLRQVSVEEFNSDVFRVKKYVPLYRMESNGDTNENRVREDLLATSGASTGRNFVNKGMTQKRQSISPLNQKPVEMGLYKTWADATERTEHFINYAGYVRELNRVYKGRDAQYVRRFIENRYGSGALKYIDDYIAEIANPNANSATGALDQIVRALRGKTAPAYLAWKASGIIKQAATSPWPYMQFVNPLEYLKANFDILTSKCKLYDDIKEKSVYMANRVMDPVMDLIKEQLENATNPVESGLNKFNAIGMKGLEWIDWACVAPGWLACYRKKYNELESANDIEVITAQVKAENDALDPSDPNRLGAEGIKAEAEARAMSEEEIEKAAVLFADDCTRLCQPSDRKVDLAPLFKSSGPGSEIGKAFLQFQTSLNVIWQNLRYDLPYAVRQKQFKQVVGMILGYVFAGLLVGSITEGYGGDDEEEKKKAWRKFVYYGTTQFTDAIPVIGGIVSGIDSKWIAGNKGFTSNSTDLIPMFTKAAKGTENMFKGNWDKALKNYGEAAGLATGLPVSGAKELLRVAGIGDGQEGLDFKPQAFVGRRD